VHLGDEVSIWVTLCNESDVAFVMTVVTTVNAPGGALFASTRFRSFLASGECGAAVRSVTWTVQGDDPGGNYRALVVAHPAKLSPPEVRLGSSKVLVAEKVHVPHS